MEENKEQTTQKSVKEHKMTELEELRKSNAMLRHASLTTIINLRKVLHGLIDKKIK